jgi:hypothetical protein
MPIHDAGSRLLQIARFSALSGCRFSSSASEFVKEETTLKKATTHRS